ncbi:MAG: PH domain-containing protein [Bacilli bacterium]|nr:PH domain-containing protein [Bacilli bacterium]
MKYNKVNNFGPNEVSPLVEGEEVLYQVKPKKNAFVINQVLPMTPFALLWLAFDSAFIIGILAGGVFAEQPMILLFIVPFFALHLMPVWMWLGSMLTANKKWENTEYYVTDKRIIIKNGLFASNFQTIYYKEITGVDLKRGLIDQMLHVGDVYLNLNDGGNMAFFDIENAEEIYVKLQKVVLDIQTDVEYPNALRPETNPGYNTKYEPKE